jgi:cytochrome c-type biogenesis protein CcmH/NrfF
MKQNWMLWVSIIVIVVAVAYLVMKRRQRTQ